MKRWGDWLIDSSLTTRNEGTWHTHKTNQKNYWRIRICVLHFFFYSDSSLFLSPPISYFGNAIAKHQTVFFPFPSISAMPLPQTNCNKKNFFLLFWQCHCHKFIPTIFFTLYFGIVITIATNQWPLFFFLEMICPHHFYNIFIANSKWHVVTGCYC